MYTNKNAKLEYYTKIENLIVNKYPNLKSEYIKAILIKQLPTADVLQSNKKNGTGKTSHIAITTDSRYFFSQYLAKATLNNKNNIFYNNNNIDYIFKIKIEQKYFSTIDNGFIDTNCALWIIQKEENQLGISKDKFDDAPFHELRKKMFEDDILVFFRYNDGTNFEDQYYLILIKEENEKNNLLSSIGNLKTKPQYYDKATDINNLFANIDDDKINKSLKGINKIFFGCPGVGKSHDIDKSFSSNVYRTTFHPEYSYYDFVGSIRPLSKFVDNKQIVTYGFAAGDFIKALKYAIDNPTEEVNFIIEELNRANTSSVFGDIFQLLDRNKNGISKYYITNSNISNYIYENCDKALVSNWLNVDINKDQVKLPNNLNIIATMNTSDQNINVLDSAFTRRWDMEYISINFNKLDLPILIEGLDISWASFATSINKLILSSNMINAEDKQLGPFFANEDTISKKKKFANKVLVYLWKDVFKVNRALLFNTSKIIGIDSLISNFENNPVSVFNNNFLVELGLTLEPQSIENSIQSENHQV